MITVSKLATLETEHKRKNLNLIFLILVVSTTHQNMKLNPNWALDGRRKRCNGATARGFPSLPGGQWARSFPLHCNRFHPKIHSVIPIPPFLYLLHFCLSISLFFSYLYCAFEGWNLVVKHVLKRLKQR